MLLKGLSYGLYLGFYLRLSSDVVIWVVIRSCHLGCIWVIIYGFSSDLPSDVVIWHCHLICHPMLSSGVVICFPYGVVIWVFSLWCYLALSSQLSSGVVIWCRHLLKIVSVLPSGLSFGLSKAFIFSFNKNLFMKLIKWWRDHKNFHAIIFLWTNFSANFFHQVCLMAKEKLNCLFQ
jgi:hypothetical protein